MNDIYLIPPTFSYRTEIYCTKHSVSAKIPKHNRMAQLAKILLGIIMPDSTCSQTLSTTGY